MYFGVIPYVYYPTSSSTEQLYSDINPYFGIWRHPKRTVRHKHACFDVQYTSNSYGARDKERSLESADKIRAVVLGDSFIDGFGVDLKDRMTDIAEASSEIEFLNFGVAGSFGHVQKWYLYKELASKFEHEQVYIFLYPSNDFQDNNPKLFNERRYRPYLRKTENKQYEVYYTVTFSERINEGQINKYRKIRHILYNNVYLLNAIRQVGEILENSELKDSLADGLKSHLESSYSKFTNEDLDLLLYSYEQIINLASGKKIGIFIIPTEHDFNTSNSTETVNIADKLREFATQFKNVQIHDLLPVYSEYARSKKINYESFFLPCDGHWSALGNRVAAEHLVKVAEDGI